MSSRIAVALALFAWVGSPSEAGTTRAKKKTYYGHLKFDLPDGTKENKTQKNDKGAAITSFVSQGNFVLYVKELPGQWTLDKAVEDVKTIYSTSSEEGGLGYRVSKEPAKKKYAGVDAYEVGYSVETEQGALKVLQIVLIVNKMLHVFDGAYGKLDVVKKIFASLEKAGGGETEDPSTTEDPPPDNTGVKVTTPVFDSVLRKGWRKNTADKKSAASYFLVKKVTVKDEESGEDVEKSITVGVIRVNLAKAGTWSTSAYVKNMKKDGYTANTLSEEWGAAAKKLGGKIYDFGKEEEGPERYITLWVLPCGDKDLLIELIHAGDKDAQRDGLAFLQKGKVKKDAPPEDSEE